jgi:hypothetical protein
VILDRVAPMLQYFSQVAVVLRHFTAFWKASSELARARHVRVIRVRMQEPSNR